MTVYHVEFPDQGKEGLVRIRPAGSAKWMEIRGTDWWADPDFRTNPVAAFFDGLLPSHACVLLGTVGAGEGPLVILPRHEDWKWVDGWWLGVFAAREQAA